MVSEHYSRQDASNFQRESHLLRNNLPDDEEYDDMNQVLHDARADAQRRARLNEAQYEVSESGGYQGGGKAASVSKSYYSRENASDFQRASHIYQNSLPEGTEYDHVRQALHKARAEAQSLAAQNEHLYEGSGSGGQDRGGGAVQTTFALTADFTREDASRFQSATHKLENSLPKGREYDHIRERFHQERAQAQRLAATNAHKHGGGSSGHKGGSSASKTTSSGGKSGGGGGGGGKHSGGGGGGSGRHGGGGAASSGRHGGGGGISSGRHGGGGGGGRHGGGGGGGGGKSGGGGGGKGGGGGGGKGGGGGGRK